MVINYQSGPVAIIGWYEGLAGQLHALLTNENIEVCCFINDYTDLPNPADLPQRAAQKFAYPVNGTFKSLPIVSQENWIDHLKSHHIKNILVASAENSRRQEFIAQVKREFTLIGYVHDSAILLPEASVAAGAIIMGAAVVGYRAEIYEGAFINTGAQVDHNSVVRECASLMPGAIICGSVEIGQRVFIGAGATVVNSICIGEDSVIGAGSLVRENVMPKSLYYGVPAKKIQTM